MELTILYPLKKIIQHTINQVPVTRYHPLTGDKQTFDVYRTDVVIPFSNRQTHVDVLHVETPRAYKKTNQAWPFVDEDDCEITTALSNKDILLDIQGIQEMEDDRSQANINSFIDIVDNSYIFHDDLSFYDTMSHDTFSHSVLKKQTQLFLQHLSTTFPSINIEEDQVVIKYK